MTLIRRIVSAFLVANFVGCNAWEYAVRAKEEPANYGAWYQMPQPPSAYPPSAYDRTPPSTPYSGYPRPHSRSPDYYPEAAVTNNMVPVPRKSSGYYSSMASQDKLRQKVIDRYYPLLEKRKPGAAPKMPDAASVMRTLKPRKPFVESWKCVKKPCKKGGETTTNPPTIPLKSKKRPNRPNIGVSVNIINPILVKSLPKTKVTPKPVERRTFATVEGIRLESVKPYTFRPKQRWNKQTKQSTTISTTTSSTPPSTSSTLPSTTEQSPQTTTIPETTTTIIPEEFPYSLLWLQPETIKRRPVKELPLNTIMMRVFQMVQYHLTNAAWEFEELKRLTDSDTETSVIETSKSPLDLNIFELFSSTPKPVVTSAENNEKIEKMIKTKKTKGGLKSLGSESKEDRNSQSSSESTKKSKQKIPNAELIAAIKDVVRKFKQSLDRTGVQDDVRQMSTQLESTWNDLRRGMQRSWLAFRQSAENAVLSPPTLSNNLNPPIVVDYPFIITRNPKGVDENNNFKGLDESNLQISHSIKTLANLFEPEEHHLIDSGKFDQWIERAHQALADSVNNSENPKNEKINFQPSQIPKEKINKNNDLKIKKP